MLARRLNRGKRSFANILTRAGVHALIVKAAGDISSEGVRVQAGFVDNMRDVLEYVFINEICNTLHKEQIRKTESMRRKITTAAAMDLAVDNCLGKMSSGVKDHYLTMVDPLKRLYRPKLAYALVH